MIRTGFNYIWADEFDESLEKSSSDAEIVSDDGADDEVIFDEDGNAIDVVMRPKIDINA